MYWKFTAASVAYFTVVEVKKQTRKVSKGDMLTFKGVLDDIPGRPKGLFISQRGYQKGALKVAAGYDIIPYELSEVTERHPISMTTMSVLHFKIRPEILSWEWTIYSPVFENFGATLDVKWSQENNITTLPVKFDLTNWGEIEFTTSGHGTVKLRCASRAPRSCFVSAAAISTARDAPDRCGVPGCHRLR